MSLLVGFPWWYWAALVIGNAPVYVGLLYLIFGSFDNFVEACSDALQPDIISWLRGQDVEDMVATLKILFWVIACVGVLACEHVLLFRHWF